jgi:hypothetical protein
MDSVNFDKSAILKAFNKHFFEFMDEIIGIIPENTEVKVARNSFDTIRQANPTTIAKVWYKYVHIPYSSIIETGDITFFFDKDYSTDLSNVHQQGRVMEIIDKIRQPIKNMSPENITHSAKYIQNLGKLSLLYAKLAGL